MFGRRYFKTEGRRVPFLLGAEIRVEIGASFGPRKTAKGERTKGKSEIIME